MLGSAVCCGCLSFVLLSFKANVCDGKLLCSVAPVQSECARHVHLITQLPVMPSISLLTPPPYQHVLPRPVRDLPARAAELQRGEIRGEGGDGRGADLKGHLRRVRRQAEVGLRVRGGGGRGVEVGDRKGERKWNPTGDVFSRFRVIIVFNCSGMGGRDEREKIAMMGLHCAWPVALLRGCAAFSHGSCCPQRSVPPCCCDSECRSTAQLPQHSCRSTSAL